MIRKIVKIDKDKCNGCGLCVDACHEGAIQMIEGKAQLVRDDYCDGLGDCLPACPMGAISMEEREAAAFDEGAVKRNQRAKKEGSSCTACLGISANTIQRAEQTVTVSEEKRDSELLQWPVQLKLVPTNASYFNGANLLIAADCSAFAYADFHKDFIKKHITLIGCPKLDGDYSKKLTEIIKCNNIKSVKIVRMSVPCCGGLSNAVINALKNSGKMIPWQIVTISTEGKIIDN